MLFPFRALIWHDGREVRIAAVEVLNGALALDLFILIQFFLEANNNGINNSVCLRTVFIRTHQLEGCYGVNVVLGIEVEALNGLSKVVKFVDIRLAFKDSCLVVSLERLANHLRVIGKVKHKSVLLLGVTAV